MSVPVRPATLGEIVDHATWLYLDHFRAIVAPALPALGACVAFVAAASFVPAGYEWATFLIAAALLPPVHLALIPVDRVVWTQALGDASTPAPGAAIGRAGGALTHALMCVLTCWLLCLPYVRYVFVPVLLAVEGGGWRAACRRSGEMVTANLFPVLGVIGFVGGLVILLGGLGAFLMRAALPAAATLAGVNLNAWTWLQYVEIALYCALAVLAMPLAEVCLVVLYREIRIFGEGLDFDEALKRLEGAA